MSESLSFPKEENLKSRKIISKIFTEGSVVKSFPLRIQFIFHRIEDFPTCQMGVSVPKRNFKKAVDRNRIKRQIKEAYRLKKVEFIQKLIQSNKQIAIMVIYSGRDKFEYSKIEKSLVEALQKIRV